jgi:hypothetical protein
MLEDVNCELSQFVGTHSLVNQADVIAKDILNVYEFHQKSMDLIHATIKNEVADSGISIINYIFCRGTRIVNERE